MAQGGEGMDLTMEVQSGNVLAVLGVPPILYEATVYHALSTV